MERLPKITLNIYWENVEAKCFANHIAREPRTTPLPDTIVICDIIIDGKWRAALKYNGKRLWLDKKELAEGVDLEKAFKR